jgi:hypothetical protein
MTFDIIMFTDTAIFPDWSRGYGAHRIASHLRNYGFSVLVIDFSSALTFDVWQELCSAAIGENTQLVGFSTTWWPYRTPFEKESNFRKDYIEWGLGKGENPDILEDSLTMAAATSNAQPWIDVVKAKNKKTKIVVGGPKLDWYLDFPADHFINGLGENQIIDLLTDKRRIWPKVLTHDINSDARDWGWNTSSTIYTDYDFIKPNEVLNLEIARGCRFKCNFCSFPLIGQKNVAGYLKTEETIYNELMLNYTKWGVTKYFIADDTYNDSIEKLEMMVRVVKRLPFQLKIKAYVRADIVATQPKQIQLLKESGLASCYIGIESFHPSAGKFAGKGMKPEKRKQALYEMQKAWGDSVAIEAGYIIGLPDEDEKFIREQAAWFAQEDCPVNYGVSFLGLIINPIKEGSYLFPSEIDKNPESFGYTIPDKNRGNFWEKNDGTDIKTYQRASELAEELNTAMRKHEKPCVDEVDYKNSAFIDPVNNYFIPLLKKLRENNE